MTKKRRKRVTLTPKIKAAVLAEYKRGLRITEIARLVGVSQGTVNTVARAAGLPKRDKAGRPAKVESQRRVVISADASASVRLREVLNQICVQDKAIRIASTRKEKLLEQFSVLAGQL